MPTDEEHRRAQQALHSVGGLSGFKLTVQDLRDAVDARRAADAAAARAAASEYKK